MGLAFTCSVSSIFVVLVVLDVKVVLDFVVGVVVDRVLVFMFV